MQFSLVLLYEISQEIDAPTISYDVNMLCFHVEILLLKTFILSKLYIELS